SQIFEYSIIAFPSVSPGIYKLPLTLEFFDGTGQKYTKSEEITIIVNPKVALDVLIESSTLTKEIKKGDIDIRIVNKGFGELKFVNLVLKESDTYKLLTSYGATYIGNIDSDDYETADFQILAKKDTVDIPITLEYMDSLNKEYSVDKTLTLELHSSNGKSGGYWKLIFFLAIVAVVGYWFYKRKKKKRR
ncbi:hypothetical protein GOV08_01145, partial [Candidatus Woesearchaeota archaeon]|nr:hypothetical protein [Candidatus Woesearchaeota archaeon]